MRIRGILFDKDGTLLDFYQTWGPINRDVALFAAGGEQALADDLLRDGGQDPVTGVVTAGAPLAAGTHFEIAEVFATRLGAATPEDLAGHIERIFRDGGALHSVPVPGVHEVLEALARRPSTLGVATSDSISGLHASLTPHGLINQFSFLAGCDSGHGSKPGPGMVHGFCAATGLSPEQVCVVGDNVHDMEMALRAGAGLRIGVLTGTSGPDDLAPHANFVLDSIAGLLEAGVLD